MSSTYEGGSGRRRRRVPGVRQVARAVRYLAAGALAGLYGLLVLLVVVAVAALSLIGVGLLLAGPASALLRRWCDRERGRVGRALGRPIGSPYAPRTSAMSTSAASTPAASTPSASTPWASTSAASSSAASSSAASSSAASSSAASSSAASSSATSGSAASRPPRDHRVADGTLARDLTALLQRVVVGIPLGVVALVLPLTALQALALPTYWWAMPEGRPADQLFEVTSWWLALASGLIGLAGLAVWAYGAPAVAAVDARLGERLLAATRDQELRLRVQIEERRRRSAVDVHSAELRRIERDLHDAAQNRLVAVSMFIGTAQRQLATGKGDIATTLAKAQDASRDALAEMRRIIRGVYPPVLAEEGLVPAVGLLSDRMQIPTRLRVDAPAPTAASVDAALYFSIAEALTNVAKHSGATVCDIHLTWRYGDEGRRVIATVTDNGRGGAEPAKGGGLAGIDDRIGALGGTVAVNSPPGGPTSVRMELPCEL